MLLFRWHSYIFPANVYYSIKINREERTAICVPKDRDRGWKSVTRLSIVFLQVYNGEAGRILRFNNAPLSSNSFPSRVFFFSHCKHEEVWERYRNNFLTTRTEYFMFSCWIVFFCRVPSFQIPEKDASSTHWIQMVNNSDIVYVQYGNH